MKSYKLIPLILCIIFVSATAQAMGNKRQDSPSQADTLAYPTRVISIGKLLDTPFKLPDGKTRVDTGIVLPELLITEIAHSTTKLRVGATIINDGQASGLSSGANDISSLPAIGRFVLVGGLTTFEASAFSGSINFGWKSGVGDIGTGGNGINGKATIDVGALGVDFHIVDTQRQEVVAVGSGSGLTGNGHLNVTVDFSQIKSGADFLLKSEMSNVFRKAIDNAIGQMANDPNTNFLMDWSTQVSSVNLDLRQILLGAGARDDVATGNLFTIYDNSLMRIGELKITNVQHDSSAGSFTSDPNGKFLQSTRTGDTAKIFFFKGSPKGIQ